MYTKIVKGTTKPVVRALKTRTLYVSRQGGLRSGLLNFIVIDVIVNKDSYLSIEVERFLMKKGNRT